MSEMQRNIRTMYFLLVLLPPACCQTSFPTSMHLHTRSGCQPPAKDGQSLNNSFFASLFGAPYSSHFLNQLNGSDTIIANYSIPNFRLTGWST
jgi:hypothetical protein